MPTILLTDTFIRGKALDSDHQIEYRDSKANGLTIRGRKRVFYDVYRFNGKLRRRKLGAYGDLTLEQARKIVERDRQMLLEGIDPKAQYQTAIETYEERLTGTLISLYAEEHLQRKTRNARETEAILKRELAELAIVPISRVTQEDVSRTLNRLMHAGKPGAANRAFSVMRTFFRWCEKRGYAKKAPTASVERPADLVERDRWLTDRELALVLTKVEAMGYPFAPLIKLLALTGQRRMEVGSMHWNHIDIDKGEWHIPAALNKSGRPHVIPLSSAALAVLGSIPKLHDTYVFPARGKNNAVSGFSKWKARLDKLCKIDEWSLHDLRRTAATQMARLQVPPHVVERILNHKSGGLSGVAGIYNRFGYLPEMRQALEVWGQHVMKLVEQAKATESSQHLSRENPGTSSY